MDNWNYELAKKHAENIAEPVTRRLTQLFLTKFYVLAFQRYAVPDNSEVDLLCFVKIIERIVSQHDLIRRCLAGEDLDAAWNALADDLEHRNPGGAGTL